MLQERWYSRCQSLRGWIETHKGHLPGAHDRLPCGFSIGSWLRAQKQQLQKQRLEGDRISALDNAAPGWRSAIAVEVSQDTLLKRPTANELELENIFTANLREAAALFAEHGSIPRDSLLGTSKYRVAHWLQNQRKNASTGRLPVERAQRLDHAMPGWRKGDISDGREKQWQNALAALIAQVKDTGRLPRTREPSAEWLYRQQKALKHGRLHEGRERALNEVVPGWKLSRRHKSEQRTGESETTGMTVASRQAGI